MIDFQPENKTKKQEEIKEAERKFNEAIKGVDLLDVDTISMNDVTTVINKTNVEVDELKTQVKNFNQTYLPLTQLANVSVVQRRLKIAFRFRELRNLYDQFNFYYRKNTSEREILDILRYVKLYNKLKDDLEKFSKIKVCDKMRKDIYQKIQNSEQIIIDTVQYIKCENLTTSDIFQLIIISISPVQFWNFFNFFDNENFNLEDLDNFKNNIQIFFDFYEKMKKITPLLEQAQLNDYIVSIEDQRNKFEKKVLSNIQDPPQKDKNNLLILYKKADQYLDFKNNNLFSENFQKILQDKIRDFSMLFLDGVVFNLQSNIDKPKFIEFLVKNSRYFQTILIPPRNESKYIEDILKTFFDNYLAIYKVDDSTSPLQKIKVDIEILSKNINEFKTPLFYDLFTKIIDIQLNSIKYILIQSFSPPSKRKDEKFDTPGKGIPKAIDDAYFKRSYQIDEIKLIYDYLINLIHGNPSLEANSNFYTNMPAICPRLFYNVSDLKPECNVDEFIDANLVGIFAIVSGSNLDTLIASVKKSAEDDRPAKNIIKGLFSVFKKS